MSTAELIGRLQEQDPNFSFDYDPNDPLQNFLDQADDAEFKNSFSVNTPRPQFGPTIQIRLPDGPGKFADIIRFETILTGTPFRTSKAKQPVTATHLFKLITAPSRPLSPDLPSAHEARPLNLYPESEDNPNATGALVHAAIAVYHDPILAELSGGNQDNWRYEARYRPEALAQNFLALVIDQQRPRSRDYLNQAADQTMAGKSLIEYILNFPADSRVVASELPFACRLHTKSYTILTNNHQIKSEHIPVYGKIDQIRLHGSTYQLVEMKQVWHENNKLNYALQLAINALGFQVRFHPEATPQHKNGKIIHLTPLEPQLILLETGTGTEHQLIVDNYPQFLRLTAQILTLSYQLNLVLPSFAEQQKLLSLDRGNLHLITDVGQIDVDREPHSPLELHDRLLDACQELEALTRWETKNTTNPNGGLQWRLRSGSPSALQLNYQDIARIVAENRYPSAQFETSTLPQIPSLELAGVETKAINQSLALIKEARDKDWGIFIYGDSDVDGILSTYYLRRLLESLGLTVTMYVPDRDIDGYGLTKQAVDKYAQNSQLIITVDNGINAMIAVNHAQSQGKKVLVLDHHRPQTTAQMIADSLIEAQDLCATGIVHLFAQNLADKFGLDLPDYSDLAALATMVDQVPLTWYNQVIVRRGLLKLQQSPHPALDFLLKELEYDLSQFSLPPDETLLNYVLGPILNSPRYVKDIHPLKVLKLLYEPTPERAQELIACNQTRRRQFSRVIKAAVSQINNGHGYPNGGGLVVHVGKDLELIGNRVAQHLQAIYDSFTVVVDTNTSPKSNSANGHRPHSLRLSPEQYKLLDQYFENGHKVFVSDNPDQEILIDAIVPFSVLTKLWPKLLHLKPFGPGNESPTFISRSITLRGSSLPDPNDSQVTKARRLPANICTMWQRANRVSETPKTSTNGHIKPDNPERKLIEFTLEEGGNQFSAYYHGFNRQLKQLRPGCLYDIVYRLRPYGYDQTEYTIEILDFRPVSPITELPV